MLEDIANLARPIARCREGQVVRIARVGEPLAGCHIGQARHRGGFTAEGEEAQLADGEAHGSR